MKKLILVVIAILLGNTFISCDDTTVDPIEEEIGNLQVNSTPVDASITLNSETDTQWKTPFQFTEKDVGTYEATLTLEGFVDTTFTADIIKDQTTTVDITLMPVVSKIETFTFSSNGKDSKGKIFLPASYEAKKSLPAIFLIDFIEQHFKVATDEFEKVVSAIQELQDFDAMVVTLEEHLNVDAKPEVFQEYYDVFKNMTSYVDVNYTNNTSRTFIGRGSEAGIVLMTLFLENSETSVFDNFIATDSPSSFNSVIIDMINKDDFPKNKLNKKLHFSFSSSNNRVFCTRTINAIKNAQYPWLKFESLEYRKNDFENTYPVSFAAGIKYIFNK